MSCTAVRCPEQPASLTSKGLDNKVVPNIWVGWKADTEELRRKAIWYDNMSGEFDIDDIYREIRRNASEPARKEQINQLFEGYFDHLNVFQKEGMVVSEQFPQIDFKAF